MTIDRRCFVVALAGPAILSSCAHSPRQPAKGSLMYGLIGKMKAVAGQRDALAAILLRSLCAMPGN
jgi:hypothetical protein